MSEGAARRRPISDYVALALLTNKKSEEIWMSGGLSDFTGGYDELVSFAEERCGFKVSEGVLKAALRTIADCDLLKVSNDQFSGEFYRIRKTGLDDFLKTATAELEEYSKDDEALIYLERNKSDYRRAFALMSHDLIADYFDFGGEWLDRALNGLKAHVGSEELTLDAGDLVNSETAPASDRVVTLSDNQSKDLESKASSLIQEFEKENSVDGDLGIRAKILGQLKAGRELLIAGVFSTHALFFTLITALSSLAKRYEKETIGALASVLLAELVKII